MHRLSMLSAAVACNQLELVKRGFHVVALWTSVVDFKAIARTPDIPKVEKAATFAQ